MISEQLKEAHEAKPFRPFSHRVSGGGIHRVPRPEFLWRIPGGRTIGVADADGAVAIVDLLLVGEVLFDPSPAEPAEAGG